MPSGPKKRRALKRKNQNQQLQESPMIPNPNPNSLPFSLHPQENGEEKSSVIIEDEDEEKFETPRFEPEAWRYEPDSVYFSIGSVKKSKGLNLDMVFEEEESSKEIKMEEFVAVLENSDGLNELDEFVDAIGGKLLIVTKGEIETEEGRRLFEQSVHFDEEMTPKALIEAADVSSSNEKEVKIVPWPDEEMFAVNEDVNVDAVYSEKGDEADDQRILEEGLQKDEDLEETKLENMVEEIEHHIPVIMNLNGLHHLDEFVNVVEEEPLVEMEDKFVTEEGLRPFEQSVPFDEEMASKDSIEISGVSSSENEVRVLSWADEEITTDIGDVNVDVAVVDSEKGGDGDGNRSLQSECQKEEVLKETKSEIFCNENEQLIHENSNGLCGLNECDHVIETGSSSEMDDKLETKKGLRTIEQVVPFDEEITCKASIEAVDISSLNEKEVNAVPWSDEEMPTDIRDVNADVAIVDSEKGGDCDCNRSLESECQIEKAVKETKLEIFTEENERPNHVTENSKCLCQLNICDHFLEEELSIEMEGKLETEKGLRLIEPSVPFGEQITPKAFIEAIDVSSSNEKDAKVVPWSDEEIPRGNGDVNVDVAVVDSERGGDGGSNRSLERECQKAHIHGFTKENEEPVHVHVNVNERDHFFEEESSSVMKDRLETEEGLRSVEQSVSFGEDMTPKTSVEAVSVSSSNEKEVSVVMSQYEEIPTNNKNINDDLMVFDSEKGAYIRSLARELKKDEGLKESNLLNLGEENKQPISTSMHLVESIQEIMPEINVALTNDNLDSFALKSSVLTENFVLIIEEGSQGGKTSLEIPEISVGAGNTTSHGQVIEAVECSIHAEKTDIVLRNKSPHGPLVVRRATLWNCCGLLEFLTSSDR